MRAPACHSLPRENSYRAPMSVKFHNSRVGIVWIEEKRRFFICDAPLVLIDRIHSAWWLFQVQELTEILVTTDQGGRRRRRRRRQAQQPTDRRVEDSQHPQVRRCPRHIFCSQKHKQPQPDQFSFLTVNTAVVVSLVEMRQ